MIITAPLHETIQIKTKNTTISLGIENKVGDFVLSGPGEYEIAGVEIEGVGKIYLFSTEEMRIAYLDKMDRPLNDLEQELVGDVDILFIPVGGDDVLDAKAALQIINQVDPRIIIPVYYQELASFTEVEGIAPEYVDSLKITRTTLPETERKVIVLPWKPLKKS